MVMPMTESYKGDESGPVFVRLANHVDVYHDSHLDDSLMW